MSVPLAKVKTVCTAAELTVVEASRRPKLGTLSLKEAQRYAERARKLRDKWRDQSRRQVRGQRRKTGAADRATRSHLKAQIFADALTNLEAASKKLAAKTAVAKPAARKTSGGNHRATRATTRKALRKDKVAANAKRKSAAVKEPAAAAKAPAKKPARARKSLAAQQSAAIMAGLAEKLNVTEHVGAQSPASPEVAIQGNLTTTPAQQLAAETAVKQNILEQTGVKSRIRGHVSARVRRDQRRRDVHNA